MEKNDIKKRIYEIFLENQETDEILKEKVYALEFSEAARDAFLLRYRRGFDWRINSVREIQKE